MKKTTALILTLALALSLCACTELETVSLPPLPTETPAAVETRPVETAAPVETETEIDAPPVIVSIKRTEMQEYDPQNGAVLILTFAYDTPTVYIEGSDAAAGINEYTSLLDESYYTGESYGGGEDSIYGYSNMLTLAEDNYGYLTNENITDGMFELVSSRTVSVERLDAQVLTLLYNDYSFTGGAHGFYGDRAYCFSTEDGALLTLESLSSDTEKLKAALLDTIVQMANSNMSILERIDQTLLVDGDLSKTLATVIRDGSWYFGREGMVIFSDLYEISSYAAGPIEFTVPYDQLVGVIDDKWIPAAQEESCEFSAVSAEEMAGGSTVILDKLTVDAEGEELYLVSKGRATDVKLTRVDYTDNAFYETADLWYCSDMTNCALQLVTMIPDGMPNLKLSYTDKDGRHELLLTQSGEDGSFILTDDNIEAVG